MTTRQRLTSRQLASRRLALPMLSALALTACAAEGLPESKGGTDEEVLQTTQLAVRGGADGVGYRLVGPLAPGAAAEADFTPEARLLVWFFQAGEGDRVEVSAQGDDPWFDTVLFLYEGEVERASDGWRLVSVGDRVAWDDDSGPGLSSQLSVEAPASGGYLVIVRRYDLGGLGTVRARLTLEPRERPCGGIVGFRFCREGEYCATESCQPNAPGVCTRRPDFCPEVFQPVCGCDGRTYGNACKAASAGVGVTGVGPCPEPPPPAACRDNGDCGAGEYCAKERCDAERGRCETRPEACVLAVIDPVCGCDGRTYSNACLAASAGVNTQAPGECPAPIEPYDPCEGKACGETCQVCRPGDPTCIETAVVKYCQPDGACSPEAPACEPAYDPCEGKACGETCRVCPPSDPTCIETAVVKYCQADGTCTPDAPTCGPTEPTVCSDTCRWAGDGECDDGGPGADYSVCPYGSDCTDCGPRPAPDCRTTGCAAGEYCSFCWGSWQCLPDGAVC